MLMRIFAVLFVLFGQQAFASGKLGLEPRYNTETGQTTYVAGLSVYEKILGSVYYNSWTGFGDAIDDVEDYKFWSVTRQHVDFRIGAFNISPGVRFSYYPELDKWGKGLKQEVAVKLSYDVW